MTKIQSPQLSIVILVALVALFAIIAVAKGPPPFSTAGQAMRQPAVTAGEGNFESMVPSGTDQDLGIKATVCDPVLQWSLGPGDLGDCGGMPLVAELTDDNGDGVVNKLDIPDIIIPTFNIATPNFEIRSGLTGQLEFSISDPELDINLWNVPIAVGDIDKDGFVEIIVPSKVDAAKQRKLIVFDRLGKKKWVSSPYTPANQFDVENVGIADFNQDGTPEIYVGTAVFNNDGTLRWSKQKPVVLPSSNNLIPSVADIDPNSPGMELLAGNTLYASDGTILWDKPTLPLLGTSAIGDLDKDGQPEIVLLQDFNKPLYVYVLDRNGNSLAAPYTITGLKEGNVLHQPLLADVDGDGKPEIIVTTGVTLRALSWSGGVISQRWNVPVNDQTTNAGPIAYDFDGDGASEIVYYDMQNWYIFDGKTGAPLFVSPHSSGTGYEKPVVADIDNDCKTEILIPFGACYKNMHAYECSQGLRARPMWNEISYHITNVNDDGTIPAVEPKSWLNDNSWLKQASSPCGPVCGNNITESPEECDDGNTVPNDGCTNCKKDTPLAVNFAYYKATCKTSDSIFIEWGTTMEQDTIGFYVEWANKKDGAYTTASPLVYATGSGSDYQWLDTKISPSPSTPEPGIFNWYKVKELASSGHGDETSPFTTDHVCDQVCGGITGLPCPEGYSCVCNPQKGDTQTSDEFCTCQLPQ